MIVDEEVETWDDETYLRYALEGFELVSTDIPRERLNGIAEDWAQSDLYYVRVQDLVGVLD